MPAGSFTGSDHKNSTKLRYCPATGLITGAMIACNTGIPIIPVSEKPESRVQRMLLLIPLTRACKTLPVQ